MADNGIKNNNEVWEFYQDGVLAMQIDNTVDSGTSYVVRNASTGQTDWYCKGELALSQGDS